MKNIIIFAHSISIIDLSGMEMLENIAHQLKNVGGGLYFLELKVEIYNELLKNGFVEDVGKDHFFFKKKEMIKYIFENKLDRKICEKCKNKVFNECSKDKKFEDFSLDYHRKSNLEN